MKMLFIYDGEYPWDIRVAKISKSLLKEKHDVYLVCRNYNAEPLEEEFNGLRIFRLPFLFRNLLFFNKLINFPVFFSPFWLIRSAQIIFRNKCHLILVRDLPLALTGILLSKLFNIPVVLDMAEVYPEALRSNWMFDKNKMKGLNYLLRNPVFAEIIEKIVVKFINHIFVVSEESKKRLLERYLSPEDKITIIGNTPELSIFYPRHPTYPGSLSYLRNKNIILFSGFILGDRGLELAIRAMPKVLQKVKNTCLIIVGEGIGKENLVRVVRELNLNENVIFEGWVDNHLLPDYIASSTLGILPFYSCAHTEITLANKLFDYMAVGLPVVVSDVKPMQGIIDAEHCGICFKANDSTDFVNKVISLLNNPPKRSEMSRRGIEASVKKYNWENDSGKIVNVLSQLIKVY